MAVEMGRFSLFGLDLRRLWSTYWQGLTDCLKWPAFSWLVADEPVHVLLPDGSEQWRLGETSTSAKAQKDAARAVVLADDQVLACDLVMPELLRHDLLQALSLQAAERSPFPLEQLVWGWRESLRDEGGLSVRMALASRGHVERYLASKGLGDGSSVEVWAGDGAPVVIRGFGEASRRRRASMRRLGILAALALLVFLALALAATPFMLKRERVFDAKAQHEALVQETLSAVSDREALLKTGLRASELKAVLQGQVDLPRLLDTLTKLMPDTAYLTRLEVSEHQVRLGGLAANASALIEALGAQPGFSDVRTPSAISRSSEGKDSFSVEFNYEASGAAQ